MRCFRSQQPDCQQENSGAAYYGVMEMGVEQRESHL